MAKKSIYPKDLQLKNIELLRIKVLGLNQVGLKFNHQIGWIITQNVTHSRIISIAWVEWKILLILLIGIQVKLLKFTLSIEKVMFDTTQGTYSKTWLYPLIFWIPLDLTFFWMVNPVTHFSTQKHISDLQQQRFKFSHLKHREFLSWTQILINHPLYYVFNVCLVNRPWNTLRNSHTKKTQRPQTSTPLASAESRKQVLDRPKACGSKPEWCNRGFPWHGPENYAPWKLLGSLGWQEWHAQRFTNYSPTSHVLPSLYLTVRLLKIYTIP